MHAVKVYEGVQVHSFLTSALEVVSAQGPTILPLWKELGGWVGPGATADAMGKGDISYTCRETNNDSGSSSP